MAEEPHATVNIILIVTKHNYYQKDGSIGVVYIFYGHLKNIVHIPESSDEKELITNIPISKYEKIAELNNPDCAGFPAIHLHLCVMLNKLPTDYFDGYNDTQDENGRTRPYNCLNNKNGTWSKDWVNINGKQSVPVGDEAFFDTYKPAPKLLVSNIDTALIIDSSGSMIWNDPIGNRLEAARYFIDRAEDLDSIAVIDFDGYFYIDPVYGTLRTANDHRDNLKTAVNKINSSGGTNIGEGLLAGFNQLLSGSANNRKIAILLTDGQSDSSHQDLAVEYADDFKNQDWPVYTIGLSDEADENLLKYIAQTTGGQYFKVSTEDAARASITQIYQTINREVHRAGQTILQESLIIAQGEIVEKEFHVSKDTQTLWADRIIPGNDVEMSLIQPDGELINRSSGARDDLYHVLGITYEIYRINKPMKGDWKVKLIGTDTSPGGEPTDLSIAVTPSSESDGGDGSSGCFIGEIINIY